jgi:xanthine dehydrogenase iron-sulfur cluster and FAD-binding subunit A
VVLRRLRGDRLVYEPVNACILLAAQADGTDVITVEDLAAHNELHPVQQAMVDHHGSQCGFCTPGFVMALFALHHRADGRTVDRAARERLDRRQSLPLHRLPADHRCGAFVLRGAGQ